MQPDIDFGITPDTHFAVEGALSPSECAEWVEYGESLGFEAAPITTERGFEMAPDVRNNTRVMFDDGSRAAELWERIREPVEARGSVEFRGTSYHPVGLNERLRIYRYHPGQYFDWHGDGAFVRDDHERSFLTAMVYLNDDFEGGTTDLEPCDGLVQVTPKAGTVFLFAHPIPHRGAPVSRGTKYALRTDVMYRRAAS